MSGVAVVAGGLDDPRVISLLREHAEAMVQSSPADMCHFLDLDGLRDPSVTFLTAWEGDTLVGCGALKDIGGGVGEIKSMRTARGHHRKGVAKAILRRIYALAAERGCERLSLETGSGDAFVPAIRLYEAEGFAEGAPFGAYRETGFNRYFHRPLRQT